MGCKVAGGDTQGLLVHIKNVPALSHTLSLTTDSGLVFLELIAGYTAAHLEGFVCFQMEEVRNGKSLVPLYTPALLSSSMQSHPDPTAWINLCQSTGCCSCSAEIRLTDILKHLLQLFYLGEMLIGHKTNLGQTPFRRQLALCSSSAASRPWLVPPPSLLQSKKRPCVNMKYKCLKHEHFILGNGIVCGGG